LGSFCKIKIGSADIDLGFLAFRLAGMAGVILVGGADQDL